MKLEQLIKEYGKVYEVDGQFFTELSYAEMHSLTSKVEIVEHTKETLLNAKKETPVKENKKSNNNK